MAWSFSASIPIRGDERLIGSLCGDVPEMVSTRSLTTASGFKRPSSAISNLLLIPRLISSAWRISFRGLIRPSDTGGSAVLFDSTRPVVCVGSSSAVSTSSLNCVGYLTPRPLPISPIRIECVGANTSTNLSVLLLFSSFIVPPKRGRVLLLATLTVVPFQATTFFMLKIGFSSFRILSNGVRPLVRSYS